MTNLHSIQKIIKQYVNKHNHQSSTHQQQSINHQHQNNNQNNMKQQQNKNQNNIKQQQNKNQTKSLSSKKLLSELKKIMKNH